MVYLVLVNMGFYWHWALESDAYRDGKPMLISNTMRNGTVKEETWDEVVGGRSFKRVPIETSMSRHAVVTRARSAIGRLRYNVVSYNCEHFVTDVLTGVKKSGQVRLFCAMACILTGAAYLMRKSRS